MPFISYECNLGFCPSGYKYKYGHILGRGTFARGIRAQRLHDCSAVCNKTARCMSFEYSEKQKLCFLNTEAEPKTNTQHDDLIFCQKISTSFVVIKNLRLKEKKSNLK